MDFTVQYVSFFVIRMDGQGEQVTKHFTHFQTLDQACYEHSTLSSFLDGELMKISKRKVDRFPKSDNVPTKIGRFTVEPGHGLSSNPNYNQFQRLLIAKNPEAFQKEGEALVRGYMDTSAIRGGAFIVIRAKLNQYMDNPFLFLLKCDFEQKVAHISDASTLIKEVEMAITTKNMKSIQYPYMPEEGMVEEGELKLHQASHARYFEDFLPFVTYEKPMPEIIKEHVIQQAHSHIAATYEEQSDVRMAEEERLEAWANTPKRELQEQWTPEQVIEAAAPIVEQQPELELKLKLDHLQVKAMLSDFGESLHIAKTNGKYVLLIEGDSFQFEKGYSPVEFLKPEPLEEVLKKIRG
ncbi:DUF3900 domain-containing protein [Halalkalibacterium halodurans]|uniref:DUF3900 domain-containing protein n=1 Tax=Halalkalibacterium halodurans TaxID=86665 RepID=UPI002AA9D7DD|nr:DUF3900 domain-containing protein [Halalkalibacterium halodurans]MDY7222341.1 DUF3900 domain-containing protein [Halalkalibacterium halodurans]MDY7241562.1 DUF3900 domain-containing protein [Halalkalibacterium halodurans]